MPTPPPASDDVALAGSCCGRSGRAGSGAGAAEAPNLDNLLGQLVHSRRWGRGVAACYVQFYGLWTMRPQSVQARMRPQQMLMQMLDNELPSRECGMTPLQSII